MTANHSAQPDPGAGATARRRPIEPDDLFRLRFVTAADLSPDGSLVAYALTRTDSQAGVDFTDLVLHEADTGKQRPLTDDDAVNTAPAFSPDGSEIAFLSSRAGLPQIFAMPVDGGEVRQITSMPRGVASGPAWSPDGSRIAFVAGPQDEPRDPSLPYRVNRAVWRVDGLGPVEDAAHDLYVIDAGGGDPTRLTADRSLNTAPLWTPDGTALVFTSAFGPDAVGMQNRLRRVDLDGTVTDVADGGVIAAHAVCPDGRILYVLTNEDGKLSGTRSDLWVHDPRSGTRERRTTALPADIGGQLQPDMLAFAFSAGTVLASDDSDSAYVRAQRGGEVGVYRVALSGPEAHEQVAGGERACVPVRLRGDRLLFAAFGMCDPGDLHLLDTSTGEEERLTRLNSDLRDQLAWPTVRHLSYSGQDGTLVEGWYLEPDAEHAPYPTVVSLHGGPYAGWGHTFVFDSLMLAGAGYGVLLPNPRGSTGYGDAFATAVHADWGNLDHQDVMAGVDHVIDAGLADADRLGVFGVSGGGTLAAWAIGHTDRFHAAFLEAPLLDLLSVHGTADIGPWLGEKLMGGPPWEHDDAYHRCSPLTYAHQCTTPTLLLVHEQDLRCRPEQAEKFHTVLRACGTVTEMLRFPGTPHAGSILGPVTHRRAQNESLLDWMDRHLA
ncbi:prolyl oligopeptidase family serine peptidase [Streptomyces sp. NPDC056296]|uniref:S9 family peptidase n=1 Tax=Streptomyces sp. NPDC056296 TaxID=3345775 RepID=UPI0035E0E52C